MWGWVLRGVSRSVGCEFLDISWWKALFLLMFGKVYIDSNTHPLTRSQVYPPSKKCHINTPFLRFRYQAKKRRKFTQTPLLVLGLVFQTKRAWQSESKHLNRCYRGKLRQTMVVSWYSLSSLDRVVPDGVSQGFRRSEVGNHERCTLNTRLSSSTSAGTFACLRGLTEMAETK